MSKGYRQGLYIVKNPHKYVGDPSKVRYMSSWELHAHQFFDNNPNVLRWASEEIAIPYVAPNGKLRRYYPDYWIEYKDKQGNIVQEMLEVKPAKQTKMSTSRGKRQLIENVQLAVNLAKWDAASKFCAKYGIRFRIITENELFK